MKRTCAFLLVLSCFVSLSFPPGVLEAAVSPQIADFLCEQGMSYYNQHDCARALVEFKKALIADPGSAVAKEYLSRLQPSCNLSDQIAGPEIDKALEAMILNREVSGALGKAPSAPGLSAKKISAQEKKAIVDIQRAVIFEKKIEKAPPKRRTAHLSSYRMPFAPGPAPSGPSITPEPPPEIIVDLSTMQKKGDFYEIECAVDDALVIHSQKVSRFVVTDPSFLNAARRNDSDVLVNPKNVGTGYMYLWDDQGRENLKFMIGPKRFPEYIAELIKEQRTAAELPQSFKVTYSIENDVFMTGRGIGDLKRTSHPFVYTSAVTGETPYGFFDSAIQGTRTEVGKYYIPNFRMSLTNAHYDQFKGIDVRAFDYTPIFNSFDFPTSDLRGIEVEAPMFNRKVHYTAFWGAIPLGNFSNLPATSGLSKTKKAWLEGIGVDYKPIEPLDLRSFYAHSYGPERTQPVVTSDTMGSGADYHIGPWGVGAEAASDTQHTSYTTRTSWRIPKLDIGMSMTDNAKNYASVFGGEPTGGDIGGTLNLTYRPTPTLTFSNAVAGDRDRVFFNPASPARPNYTGSSHIDWMADEHTEYEIGYDLDDRLGSNTPSVTESKEIIFRKKLFFIRKLATFISYQNRKSKNLTSPAQDFNNNRILAGLSFRVISELYLYYNREYNMLRNKFSNETASPMAQEIGLNYYRRIFNSPFYGRMRASYHTEENVESPLSYLSGEDRLEGEGELTYKPTPDQETFLRLRVTNVWAAKPGVTKHFDVDLAWGVRLLWDTGFRWMPRGSFQGYVYYDANADGVRQAGERGLAGVVIKTSQGQTATTDAKGYYKIKDVVGKLTTLELNTKTLPRNYSPTTSVSKDVDIVHATTKRVDFGATTRMEVSGIVFLDKNGNGKYDPGVDEPVKGVVIVFDGKEKIASSILGEYMFRKMAPGEHTVAIDLKTLPLKYIPKVPVKKTIRVAEGEMSNYYIPLELQSQ